jgi:hypothetical protein
MQDVLFTRWLRYSEELYPLVSVSSLRGSSDQVRAITILSYRNQALCYSRTVAYFSGPDMLFSSGDSPQSASSNLSGEGFDEVQPGESPFVVFAAKPLRLHTLLMVPVREVRGRNERQPKFTGTMDRILRPTNSPWILRPVLRFAANCPRL